MARLAASDSAAFDCSAALTGRNEGEGAVLGSHDLLLRRIDARCASRLLRGCYPARQLGETGGQVLGTNRRIAKLGAAPDYRPFGAVEMGAPSASKCGR